MLFTYFNSVVDLRVYDFVSSVYNLHLTADDDDEDDGDDFAGFMLSLLAAVVDDFFFFLLCAITISFDAKRTVH